MDLKNLKFSLFENETFYITPELKISGMFYRIMNIVKNNFKNLVETIELIEAAYPIPRNLQKRIENLLLPCFYELIDFLKL